MTNWLQSIKTYPVNLIFSRRLGKIFLLGLTNYPLWHVTVGNAFIGRVGWRKINFVLKLSGSQHWSNTGSSNYCLSVGHRGTYFNEILFEFQKFSSKKMYGNTSSAKIMAILPRPRCVKGEPIRAPYCRQLFQFIFCEGYCVLIQFDWNSFPKVPLTLNI